jgi:hypothetical protein
MDLRSAPVGLGSALRAFAVGAPSQGCRLHSVCSLRAWSSRWRGAETEFDLLGLFRGRGLAHRGATEETGELPNMIWLYRRPLLDFWCDGEDSLDEVVTHVLVHEIGHHFGLSDADMEAIEQKAAAD